MSEPQLSYVSALIAERDDLRARVAELETEVHRAQTRAQAMHDLYAELEARWAAIPWESMSLVGAFVPGSVVAINTTLQAFYAWLDANAPKEEGT